MKGSEFVDVFDVVPVQEVGELILLYYFKVKKVGVRRDVVLSDEDAFVLGGYCNVIAHMKLAHMLYFQCFLAHFAELLD